MYFLVVSHKETERLKEFSKVSPSIITRMEEFVTNPLARAKNTNKPVIGEYYVNAGRFCIVFDVDESKQEIKINAVCYSAFLHKILTDWN